MSNWLPTRAPIWVARARVTKVVAYASEVRLHVLKEVMRRGWRATHEVVLL